MGPVNRTAIRLVPHKQVVRGSGTQWRSTGSTPQFRLVREDGRETFAKGWYVLKVALRTAGDPPDECALYPDYGTSSIEEDRIPLKRLMVPERGLVQGIVLLKHDAATLRFDPCHSPQDFSIGEASLTEVSRARVVGTLLRPRARESIGHWCGRLCQAARAWRGEGLRQGVANLYSAYLGREADLRLGYTEWLRRYDGPSTASALHRVTGGPSLSVVVPTHDTDAHALRECIESVRGQGYPNWELCIADDRSTRRETLEVLRSYEGADPRIKIVFRQRNGHISAATNSALGIAGGDFAVLLDHDDRLHPEALSELAAASLRNPHWDLLYTDEDKLDFSGRRCEPYFKPDFNLDLLRGQNCISHLAAYRMEALRRIGGLRSGFEGSQDWDLALRFVEHVGPDRVGHIPRVLYHWRKSERSTAADSAVKPYARKAALDAIQEHLARTGSHGAVEDIPGQPGNYRVRYALPAPAPRISVVVPSRDQPGLLERCIDSIRATTPGMALEFVLVDNGSRSHEARRLFDKLADEGATVIRHDHQFNYSQLNNLAADRATGDLLLFVNDDVEAFQDGWLEEMASHAMRAEVGAVGAKLYYSGGRIQHAGVVLGGSGAAAHVCRGNSGSSPGAMNRLLLTQNYSAVTAACLAMRREVFAHVGGFDEALAVDFNDVDLCLRLREQGLLVVWTPFARLFHHESLSRGTARTPEDLERAQREQRIFRRRWAHWLDADPGYNPNLDLDPPGFRLAWPPRPRSAVSAVAEDP